MFKFNSYTKRVTHWVLAQEASTQSSDARRSGMIATVLILSFGVATAFGFSPSPATHERSLPPLIEDITPSVLSYQPNNDSSGVFTEQYQIQNGESLSTILAHLGVDDPSAFSFIKKDSTAHHLIQEMGPGHLVLAQHLANGELISLKFPENTDQLLLIQKTVQGFESSEIPITSTNRLIRKSGQIQSSLFASADDAGIPDSVTRQISTLFSTDIDFHNDLRPGDHFSVIYEAKTNEFGQTKNGKILAAEFINKGQTFRRIYFDGPDGGDYYTADGQGTRSSFLRSPIEFSRVTSPFQAQRFHPILKEWRSHKGIDLAARQGTPVLSVANGTVLFSGWKNGYGNVVELSHADQISTVYGHLSAFGGNIHRGMRVKQGQIIGYVGMTGLATGPHLHYEFKIAGIQHDPLGKDVSRHASTNLAGKEKTAFLTKTTQLTQSLNQLETIKTSNSFE
jgi:murein DD-endopeptidase MepM/ murein hydrolase activator NlpD